jgi:DnaJ-domain-containing protein 1
MNHFERFGLEPRPWIDLEILKEKFLQFSAAVHPDKADPAGKHSSERQFQELNESYNILRNTRARLLHLLELSGAPKQEHVQNVPSDTLELFPAIASATNRADTLLREKTAIDSPMLKVQVMERAMEQIEALQEVQAQIAERIRSIEASLRNLPWSTAPSADAQLQVRGAAAALGFFERWNAQLQDRIGALTF